MSPWLVFSGSVTVPRWNVRTVTLTVVKRSIEVKIT